MTGKRTTIPAALLILVAAHLPARALPDPAETWVQVTSPAFTLYSNAPEEEAVKAAADLERLLLVFSRLAPQARLIAPLPTQLFLFRDEASFSPYRVSAEGLLEAGFLAPHEHGTWGGLVGSERSATRYLYKQYIHHLLHQRLPGLPLWFRRGLAELYSTFEADASEARIGLPIRDYVLRLRRAGATPIPVEEVFAGTGASGAGRGPVRRTDGRPVMVDALLADLELPRCWALVHYLLIGDEELRGRSPAFVGQLLAGKPSEVALREALGITPAVLEGKLAEYVAGESFLFLRVRVSTPSELELETAPVPRWRVLYHLGDLLVHTAPGKGRTAAEHFRQALALNPEHGPSWARLGYLAELHGRAEEARDLYAKAAPLALDDFVSQYLYGASLLATLHGRPQSEEELARLRAAETALARAVELEADLAGAWERLGLAYGLEHEPSREGAAALEQALSLSPGRPDLAFNLLLAYARLGEGEKVGAIAESLARMGAEAEILARAREVRLQMDFQQANRLLRQDRFGDALALFARIEALSANPELSRVAGEQVARIAAATEHNRFAEGYREAVRLYHAGETAGARAILAELAAGAPPGSRQEEVIRELQERLDERH